MISLIFCRGKGILSALIRWQTWSNYSHVALRINNSERDEVWEAWPGKGVHRMSYRDFTRKGTKGMEELFIYKPAGVTPEEWNARESLLHTFLDGRLGSKYDYLGVFRFLVRFGQRRNNFTGKYFCSQLAAAMLELSHIPLFKRVDAAKISPAMLRTSVLLSDEEGD